MISLVRTVSRECRYQVNDDAVKANLSETQNPRRRINMIPHYAHKASLGWFAAVALTVLAAATIVQSARAADTAAEIADRNALTAAAATFLLAWDSEDAQKCWVAYDQSKATTSAFEKWKPQFEAMHDALGEVRGRRLFKVVTPHLNDGAACVAGDKASVMYFSTFQHHEGDVRETVFLLKDQTGIWKVEAHKCGNRG
jgi:Protein of unknown function (DUF4019)